MSVCYRPAKDNSALSSAPPRRKLRVAAYCRVSTLADSQDMSYETQCAHYTQYITQHPDYELAGIYGDRGKSGQYMKTRPELQRLLQDCESGKIDLILIKSVSRLARNMKECLEMLRKLQNLNVRVYFEREAMDSANPQTELFLSIVACIAQEESKSISRNLLWMHERRNREGRPVYPRACYGYTIRNGIWRIHEAQARRVRLAFERADAGVPLARIREEMNALEAAEGTGKVWKITQPGQMLRRVDYMGDLLTNQYIPTGDGRRVRNRGEKDQYYIEDHHIPIISREVFERVQARLSSAKNSKDNKASRERDAIWRAETQKI